MAKLTKAEKRCMTQSLTTETIKLWRSSAEITLGETDELDPENNAAKAILALTAELLANREAQSVPIKLSSEVRDFLQEALNDATKCENGDIDHEFASQIELLLNPIYTAPPAPAVPTPVNFSENADADTCRKWAWEQVKELVSADGWTMGDNITYFGFFCWGWDMRRQYNEQRPSTGAAAVPTIATMENVNTLSSHFSSYIMTENERDLAVEVWNACRTGMLDQSLSEGYKLVPIVPSDEHLRAILEVSWPATYRDHLRHPDNGPVSSKKTEDDIKTAIAQYAAMLAPTEGK